MGGQHRTNPVASLEPSLSHNAALELFWFKFYLINLIYSYTFLLSLLPHRYCVYQLWLLVLCFYGIPVCGNEWLFISCTFSWTLFLLFVCFVLYQCVNIYIIIITL